MVHRSFCAKLALSAALLVSMWAVAENCLFIVEANSGSIVGGQAQCPKVSVTSPDSVKPGGSLMFVANVSSGDKNVSPTYNWSISAGTISSGQGTSAITVDTASAAGQTITATVDLGGYERNCSAYASSTTSVEQKLEAKKITEYGAVTLSTEQDALDALAIELQVDPTSQGYIVAYGSSTVTTAKLNISTRRAKDFLVTKRKIDASRLIVVNGGNRKTAITEFWMVPNGATPPAPTPDVAPAKTTPVKPKTNPTTE